MAIVAIVAISSKKQMHLEAISMMIFLLEKLSKEKHQDATYIENYFKF